MTAGTAPYRLPPRISMIDAVRRCLRQYATFSGRAPRAESWKSVLAVLLALIASIIIRSLIWGPDIVSAGSGLDGQQSYVVRYHGGLIGTVIVLGAALPLLAVTWRRLHDTGLPGWWSLAPLALTLALIVGMLVAVAGPAATVAAMTGGAPVTATLPSPFGYVFGLLIFGSFLLLILRLARQGGAGRNRFGPNPLEVTP